MEWETVMDGSKTWTSEEAVARFDELLLAAEISPQYISTPTGRFVVSIDGRDEKRLQGSFPSGRLDEKDIEEG